MVLVGSASILVLRIYCKLSPSPKLLPVRPKALKSNLYTAAAAQASLPQLEVYLVVRRLRRPPRQPSRRRLEDCLELLPRPRSHSKQAGSSAARKPHPKLHKRAACLDPQQLRRPRRRSLNRNPASSARRQRRLPRRNSSNRQEVFSDPHNSNSSSRNSNRRADCLATRLRSSKSPAGYSAAPRCRPSSNRPGASLEVPRLRSQLRLVVAFSARRLSSSSSSNPSSKAQEAYLADQRLVRVVGSWVRTSRPCCKLQTLPFVNLFVLF